VLEEKGSDGNLGRVLDGDAARKSGEVKVNLLSSSKAYGSGQSGAIDFSASLLMVARLTIADRGSIRVHAS